MNFWMTRLLRFTGRIERWFDQDSTFTFYIQDFFEPFGTSLLPWGLIHFLLRWRLPTDEDTIDDIVPKLLTTSLFLTPSDTPGSTYRPSCTQTQNTPKTTTMRHMKWVSPYPSLRHQASSSNASSFVKIKQQTCVPCMPPQSADMQRPNWIRRWICNRLSQH